jgi:thymidylate synthase (FAD)
MKVTLVTMTPQAEVIIEQMGRIAHRSEAGATATGFLIHKLIGWGHESVLEHASATIEASEISRTLSHQLVRHRLVAYTQESQRYVEQGNFGYVVPLSILDSEDSLATFDSAMAYLQQCYENLIDAGIPPEDARFVLPNACYTRIGITANFRQWRHMIQLRCDKHAQWEIREMFGQILHLLHSHAPSCFEDLMKEFKS